MSPSGSRRQISGTAAFGKFLCRRASRSKFAGSKTEGAVKFLPARIGGGSGTSVPRLWAALGTPADILLPHRVSQAAVVSFGATCRTSPAMKRGDSLDKIHVLF